VAEYLPPSSGYDALGADDPQDEPEERFPGPNLPATDEVAQEAATVVRTILEHIGIRARVDVERAHDEYYINIKPQLSKGLLIGRRGTTLRAIQYLTRLIIRRRFPDVAPVTVDVGGYRLRRESFLAKKAEAVSRIVLETKREMSLDLLTEKEMELIAEHLKIIPEVRVYSVPAGTKQNVIIAPKIDNR
jgi:spoIIIJ-associated protein